MQRINIFNVRALTLVAAYHVGSARRQQRPSGPRGKASVATRITAAGKTISLEDSRRRQCS